MLERSLARRVAVIGVRHDGTDEFFGVVLFPQNFCAFGRMLAVRGVVSVGPALVIEIVEQSCEAPELIVGA